MKKITKTSVTKNLIISNAKKGGCLITIDRIAEAYLERWYNKSYRKPLILKGARQVGKSTLVRKFATKNKLLLHEINLERYMDMNRIFKTLDINIYDT